MNYKSHTSLGDSGRGRSACLGLARLVAQLRPDALPSLLAKLLALQSSTSDFLNPAGLCRIHVAAAGQALIEVLVIDASLLRKLAAF